MKLTYNEETKKFEFRCRYEEKSIPKSNGFRWDGVRMVWYADLENAVKLEQYYEGGKIPQNLLKEPSPFLTFKDNYYIFNCSFKQKDAAKSGGFWWHRDLQKWVTKDVEVAHKAKNYASGNVLQKIEEGYAEKIKNIEDSRKVSADIEIPSNNGLEYLPFQKAGIAYSLGKENVIIADEMGLGKTIQAIGVYNASDAKSMLVVCPAFLKKNWEREIKKWNVKGTSVAYSNGDFPNTDIVIVNYNVMEKFSSEIRKREWDILVLDEAHYVKNYKAKRTLYTLGGKVTKTVEENGHSVRKDIQITPIPCKRKIFLTGTPMLNKPVELWSLINSLDPKTWNNWYSYVKRYCDAHRGKWGWEVDGASNLDELQKKLRSSFLIRRLKKDVLSELPPKRRQIIEIAADNGLGSVLKREQSLYSKFNENLENLYVAVEISKASENKDDYFDAVSALKGGYSALFSEMAKLRLEMGLAVVPYVVEELSSIIDSGEKVVCFTHHIEVAEKIYDGLKAVKGANYDGVVVHGKKTDKQRDEAIERFQRDAFCNFFVGTRGAAGVGITLTASSNVVHAEWDWVPANISQADDRCHRIGQVNSVLVKHIVIEGSLGAYMAERVVEKQQIIDATLDNSIVLDDTPILVPPTVISRKESVGVCEVSNDRLDTLEKLFSENSQYITVVSNSLNQVANLCDNAVTKDSVGFNKVDYRIGKALSSEGLYKFPRRAAYAYELVYKYKRQLSSDLVSVLDEIKDKVK